MATSLFAQDPSTSQSTPLYQPGVQDLSSFLSNQVLSNFLLPYQKDQITGWGNLGRGAFGLAPSIEGPARSAGLQGMAQLGANTSFLPGTVAAPLQESTAFQARQMPRQLQAIAPDQLAALVKALIDPQFAGLLSPGSSTASQTGGSSAVSSGLAIGNIIETLAKLGQFIPAGK